ncbi:MAG: hypothetical protein KAR00_00670 [Candidatus Pacebacteria bacterium]|nr:hypothetical protein [Candidatus Paceibacterota bacterium]
MGRDTIEIFSEVSEEHRGFIESIVKYLKQPSKRLKEEVSQKAKEADNSQKSHYEVQTYFSRGLKSRLIKLQCMERQEWVTFLYENFNNQYLRRLKKFSPFKDSFLFLVDYEYSLPKIYNELGDYLHGGFEESFMLIIEQKGLETYSGNVYLVACDSPNMLKGEPFLVYEKKK